MIWLESFTLRPNEWVEFDYFDETQRDVFLFLLKNISVRIYSSVVAQNILN